MGRCVLGYAGMIEAARTLRFAQRGGRMRPPLYELSDFRSGHECSILSGTVTKTLHIVDGDSTGGTVRTSSLSKGRDILVWREALYTGPVPAGLTLRQLSRVRSQFWSNGKSSKELDKRDAALANYAEYEHVVLWFGPNCVLCQLSLMQVLSWFREQGVPSSRLSWVARHGGELHPSRIAGAYSKRRPVVVAQMRLAQRAWHAFRQPTPAGTSRLLRADVGAIPGLQSALTRLLQEYPSSRNGLSRLEMLLLRAIQKAGSLRAAVAVGSIIAKETVGDTLLFDMLREFVGAADPLVEFAEPFRGNVNNSQFNGAVLKLSDLGKRVLAGKADHVSINGIDRWIGGVHLRGKDIRWRWDQASKRIVQG